MRIRDCRNAAESKGRESCFLCGTLELWLAVVALSAAEFAGLDFRAGR